MNSERVRDVIQYALAVAAGSDDGRELGTIHLLKYVYLVDLAYAEKHGETFTGAPWRFYKFGPWCEEVWKTVEPAVNDLGSSRRTFTSVKFEGEGVRWQLRNDVDEVTNRLEKRIPWEVARVVRRHVKQFGDDTSELLHYVYATKPMLDAAPGKSLAFRIAEEPEKYEAKQPEQPTERQRKKLRQLRDKVREQLSNRMSQAKTKLVAPDPPPRYDDTFDEGLRALDAQAGEEISSEQGEMALSDEVWGSRGRHDTGAS